jgi:hypothetical protein
MRGCIERITSDRVSGWVIDDGAPDRRVIVKVYLDNSPIGESIAENFREDLRANNVGDGRYGYIVPISNCGDIAALFLQGRIRVEGQLDDLHTSAIGPAAYLAAHLRASILIEGLGQLTFEQFIDHMTLLLQEASEVNEVPFHIFNSSRAHFPEWRSSVEFLTLGTMIATRCDKPLTLKFYRDILGSNSESIERAALPRIECGQSGNYGGYRDLIGTLPKILVKYEKPIFLGGGHPKSFIEESGFFINDSDNKQEIGKTVRLLAFREYAFGEPTWYVYRQSVRATVAKQLYYLDFESVLSTLSGEGLICIDMSNEGPPYETHWSNIVRHAMNDLGIPREKLIYVTQNLAYAKLANYSYFAGAIGHAHFFINSGLATLEKDFPNRTSIILHINQVIRARLNLSEDDGKYFICLNFTPRWHRWITVLFLLHRSYLSRGFVSFPGKQNFKMEEMTDLNRLVPRIHMRDELLARVSDLLEVSPLVLDVMPGTRATPNYEFPYEMMGASLFQIVTESEVGGLLKPIVGLQPFIVLG